MAISGTEATRPGIDFIGRQHPYHPAHQQPHHQAMKIRESGMPDEHVWQDFFSPEQTLRLLGMQSSMNAVVDLGCGYGTFTIPAAQLVHGKLHAFDLEADMIAQTRNKAEAAGLDNVILHQRDFVHEGTGLPDESSDYVMLFNILHGEHPVELLREAHRVLVVGGLIGMMHWNPDPETPRGPPIAIRPRPVDLCRWAESAGFEIIEPHIDLPPWHYGITARRV